MNQQRQIEQSQFWAPPKITCASEIFKQIPRENLTQNATNLALLRQREMKKWEANLNSSHGNRFSVAKCYAFPPLIIYRVGLASKGGSFTVRHALVCGGSKEEKTVQPHLHCIEV
jgi:hypothetical protein